MNKNEFASFSKTERMNRVLEGTAFYACLHTPNFAAAKRFNADPKFEIKLGLDDENIAKAKSYGLKVRDADKFIPMPYVILSRKVKAGKEPDEVKPEVVDSMQKEIPPTILIGNGSKVICKFGTDWYDTQGGGVSAMLWKTQVRELVPYVPMDKDLAMDEDGFTVGSQTDSDFDDEKPFDD